MTGPDALQIISWAAEIKRPKVHTKERDDGDRECPATMEANEE